MSTSTDHFHPLLPLSVGFGPVPSPPQGALCWLPSTHTSDRSRPIIRSKALIACCTRLSNTPAATQASRRRRQGSVRDTYQGTGVLPGTPSTQAVYYTFEARLVVYVGTVTVQGMFRRGTFRQEVFHGFKYRVDDPHVHGSHNTNVRIGPISCTYRTRLSRNYEDFNNLCLLSGPLRVLSEAYHEVVSLTCVCRCFPCIFQAVGCRYHVKTSAFRAKHSCRAGVGSDAVFNAQALLFGMYMLKR